MSWRRRGACRTFWPPHNTGGNSLHSLSGYFKGPVQRLTGHDGRNVQSPWGFKITYYTGSVTLTQTAVRRRTQEKRKKKRTWLSLFCSGLLSGRCCQSIPRREGLQEFVLLHFNMQVIVPLSYLCFGMMWLLSCFTPAALSAHYPKEDYNGDAAFKNPLLMKTNLILSLCWGDFTLSPPYGPILS